MKFICITFHIQDLWGCKGFPLKTGFCFVQIPFITGFILHDMLLLFVTNLCTLWFKSNSSPLWEWQILVCKPQSFSLWFPVQHIFRDFSCSHSIPPEYCICRFSLCLGNVHYFLQCFVSYSFIMCYLKTAQLSNPAVCYEKYDQQVHIHICKFIVL
jgi:hypothetical protein